MPTERERERQNKVNGFDITIRVIKIISFPSYNKKKLLDKMTIFPL